MKKEISNDLEKEHQIDKKVFKTRCDSNPFKFFKIFLVVAFGVKNGDKDIMQLNEFASYNVKNQIRSLYLEQRKAGFPGIEAETISTSGFRVNTQISEMAATIIDGGMRKLCTVRAEFANGFWKITSFLLIPLKIVAD